MKRLEMLQKLTLGANPLEVSIEKWQDIVDGKGEDEGSSNCALCEKFFHSVWYGTCKKCPVKLRTGQGWCKGTPIIDYNAYFDFKFFSDTEAKRLAQLELDFLKSLRTTKMEGS